MMPAQFSPGGPSDSPESSTRHAARARAAVDGLLRAKQAGDTAEQQRYSRLIQGHLRAHLELVRRRLP